jgi:hypothetical protein
MNIIYIWKKIRRLCKHTYQYWSQGFSDKETWYLNNHITEFILPRLILFKKLNDGFPPEETAKSWDKKLDKMIKAFETQKELEKDWDGTRYSKKDINKMYKQMKEGLELFAKHYNDLWW